MTDYDKFARFYDQIMGQPAGRIRLVKKLISKYHPNALTLLELACGTGSMLEGLAGRYRVCGLERSEKMLEIARAKVPEAEFFRGDMADFELGKKFDVIICVFDSINHLTDFERWQSLFKKTHEHLNPGGLLIFDMDTISRLKIVTLAPFEETFDGGRAKVKVSLEVGLFVWYWKFFEDIGDGQHKISSEKIAEASFEIKLVSDKVAKRFKIMAICDPREQPATEQSSRVYFVCKKQTDPGNLGP